MVAPLSFCAIDFETACGDRSSVCSVGVVRVRDGIVSGRYGTLVQPPTGVDSFQSRNIEVHGITPHDVIDAPSWDVVFPEVMAFIGNDALVAHNASFDRSVMESACTAHDLDWPTNTWHDTLGMAKGLLTLGSYTLPFVSAALGLPEFDHHHAQADAEQAALVALRLAETVGALDLDALRTCVADRCRSGAAATRVPGDFSGLGDAAPLAGEFVAFTGKLTTNTREEALALVNQLGGTGQKAVTKKTTMLVTGDFDPKTFRPGASFTEKLQTAMSLAEAGQPIEIVTEIDFLDRVELSREELERVTREQRAQARGSGWLPGYVIEQARSLDAGSLSYNAWVRAALRHPAGRAGSDDACVRCGGLVAARAFWLFAERHVCSADCAEALKRAAKREWKRAGLVSPMAPAYSDLEAWAS